MHDSICLVPLINSNLLICNYLVFVVKILIDHSSSLTSSEHSHRAIWEAVSLGLWSQNVCWITHNSQVLDYVFFSFHKGITHILHGWVSKAPSLLEDLDKGKARVEMKQKGKWQSATFKRRTHSHRTWQKLVRANEVQDGGKLGFQETLSLIVCSLLYPQAPQFQG